MMCCIQKHGTLRNPNYRTIAKIFFLVLLGATLLSILLIMISFFIPTQYTQTTDIADYGVYKGTHDDVHVSEFINSFFPATIEDSFEVIKYSYRAENEDTYGFETYLEIHIEDTDAFDRHIASVTAPENWKEFAHDAGYMEYEISDELVIWAAKPGHDATDAHYQIEWANVKKVLYSPKTQTVIYVAIGVYDGGSADTEYLGVFFERFGIDPSKY